MKINKFRLFVMFILLMVLSSSISTVYAGSVAEMPAYDKVGIFVRAEMQAVRIPGLSVGIVENGRIIYLKGFGRSDSKGTAVTPETNFYIGSITKSFTALAVRQLISGGKIDESAPVIEYLPWFRTNNKTVSDNIRVIDLINHTSGFSQEDGMAFVSNFSSDSLEQSIRSLNKVKLKFPPGFQYDYSNINYSILGLIIEKVTGGSYGKYVEQNIFKPLDMDNTFVVANEELAGKVATSHKVGFGIAIPVYPRVRLNTVPSGYISSCAEDMCAYAIAYMGNGVLNGKSLVTSGTPLLSDLVKSERGGYQLHYDMFWNPVDRDLKLDGAPTGIAGAFPCTMAEMLIYPEKNLGIVALANSRNDRVAFIHDITMGIADILEGGSPETASDQNFNAIYAIVDVAAIIILFLMILHLKLSFSFIMRLRNSKRFNYKDILSCILIDFVTPLTLLFGIPPYVVRSNHLNYNWSGIIFDGVQEVFYLYILCWVLLGVGSIRLISMFIFSVLKSKSKKDPRDLTGKHVIQSS